MEFITTGLLASIEATLLLGVTLWACARMGEALLARFDFFGQSEPALEQLVLSSALGLILFSLGILLIGLLGFFYQETMFLLLAVFILLPALLREKKGSFPSLRTLNLRESLHWLFFGVLMLSWIQALAPPTGMDALAYHLEHPKQFIYAHRLHYVPFTRESLWPYQTEMLFTYGLLLQGTTLAQLFHWCFYGLTVAAVYVLSARWINKNTARIAALIYLLTPMAFAQSGQAYVDMSLAFYVTLAVHFFLKYSSSRKLKNLFLCAVFAGAAAGTKYLGVGCCAILFAFVLIQSPVRPKDIFIFLAGTSLIAGIWYIRSWVLIGNPVYPFFHSIFGSGWNTEIGKGVGVGYGFENFLKLLWDIALNPVPFGSQIMGPFYLLFIPCAALFWIRPAKEHIYLGVFSLLYTFFVFTQAQQARFYLSAAPLWAVGAAVGFERLLSQKLLVRTTACAVFVLVACTHLAIFVYRLKPLLPVVSGTETAEAYLLRKERSFGLYYYLNKHQKSGDRLFNAAEARHFYNPIKQMVYASDPWYQDLRKKNQTSTDFLEKGGFEYILLASDSKSEYFDFVKRRHYERVFTYSFTEKPFTIEYLLFYKKHQMV